MMTAGSNDYTPFPRRKATLVRTRAPVRRGIHMGG